MRGTLVCGVTDSEDAAGTVELAVELTKRLGMRLVLAHVAEGFAPLGDGRPLWEGCHETRQASVPARLRAQTFVRPQSMSSGDPPRDHAANIQASQKSRLDRIAVGSPATLLGQIAAEEAADVILVGSRERGWPRRGLESRLAAQLETETPVPILIAPPRTRPGRRSVAMNGAAR